MSNVARKLARVESSYVIVEDSRVSKERAGFHSLYEATMTHGMIMDVTRKNSFTMNPYREYA